jgi:hypothetical protein
VRGIRTQYLQLRERIGELDRELHQPLAPTRFRRSPPAPRLDPHSPPSRSRP